MSNTLKQNPIFPLQIGSWNIPLPILPDGFILAGKKKNNLMQKNGALQFKFGWLICIFAQPQGPVLQALSQTERHFITL